jgi:two-component system, LuxR family, sensor kinase FixL
MNKIAESVATIGYSSTEETATSGAFSSVKFAEAISSQFHNAVKKADATLKRPQDILQQLQAARPTQLITPAELTASIVHEVMQPLTTLVNNGESCLRWLDSNEPQSDRVRETVAAMISSACRVANIIRRLRALSVKGDIQREELNVNEIIEHAVALIESDVLRNSVSLRLDLSSDLPLVLGDSIQLQLVITNLLANGVQAMVSVSDRPRELVVRSQKLDLNHIGIMVKDSGTGIDPDDMDRIFDTFFTTRVDGTGIGLSLCRWIIEAHGGLIWASSDSGGGASFYFALSGIRSGTT